MRKDFGNAVIKGYHFSTAGKAAFMISLNNCYQLHIITLGDGKDICDAFSAIYKRKITKYIIENKSQVTTPKEMAEALVYDGHITNTIVLYGEVKNVAEITKVQQLKGISGFYSYDFSDEGILYKQYPQIGTGKTFIPEPKNQTATFDCEIIFQNGRVKPENATSKQCRPIIHKPVVKRDSIFPEESYGHLEDTTEDNGDSLTIQDAKKYFECPTVGCIKVFSSPYTLNSHIAANKHTYRTKTMSTADEAKNIYQQEIAQTSFESLRSKSGKVITHFEELEIHELPEEINGIQTSDRKNFIEKGYGISKKEASKKHSQNVRAYVEEIFEKGRETGHHAKSHEVAEWMQDETVCGGTLPKFTHDEYLHDGQISSLFSYFNRQRKDKGSAIDKSGNEDEQIKRERKLLELIHEQLKKDDPDIQIYAHPIMVTIFFIIIMLF